MKSKLSEIAEYFRSTEYFMSNYPQWREFRDRTTSQLEQITNSLVKSRKDFSEKKKTGISLSAIGGLLCLATGTGVIGLAAKVMFGLGSLITATVALNEASKLQKMIKEAKEIMEVDKDYSEGFWRWISDERHKQNVLDDIRNINVDINLQTTARVLHACFINKSTPEELKMIIERAVESLNVSPEIIVEVSDVIGILISIIMLSKHYRPLRDELLVASKGFQRLIVGKVSCDETSSACVGQILFDLALEAMKYLETKAVEFIESTSEEAEEIVKVKNRLQAEARIFQKLYEEVVQMSCPKVVPRLTY